MVEGNLPPQNWPKYSLQQLLTPINNARAANKYLLIWDKQGNVGTFLQYKAYRECLGPEVVKAALGRQTPADVGEFMRKAFVNCMRTGEILGFDLESSAPDFVNFNSANTFNAAEMFDWNQFN